MNDTLTNSIGNQMELLARLGMELQKPLDELANACATSLLSGGKLILISDSESQYCQNLLSHLLSKGEIVERPTLPMLSIHTETSNTGSPNIDMLEHLYQPDDIIILIARDAQQIDTSLIHADQRRHTICAHTPQPTNSPNTLGLTVTNRSQWLTASTLLCNLLVQQIEQRLFGLTPHE